MRAVLRFLFSALGILAASSVVPGIHAGRFVDLLAVAVILGFFNATLGQFLKAVAFVPVACTFGCLNLFINGLVFLSTIDVLQCPKCSSRMQRIAFLTQPRVIRRFLDAISRRAPP